MKLVVASYFEPPDAKTMYVSASITVPTPDQSQVPVAAHFPQLAPSRELLNLWDVSGKGILAQSGYVTFYRRELTRKRDPIMKRFAEVVAQARAAGYERIALCCWESKSKFCHRHTAASWILAQAAAWKEEQAAKDAQRTVDLDAAVEAIVSAKDQAAIRAKADARNAAARARRAARKLAAA